MTGIEVTGTEVTGTEVTGTEVTGTEVTGPGPAPGQPPIVLRPLPVSRVSGVIGGILMAAIGATLVALGMGNSGGSYSVWSWLLAGFGAIFGLYGLVVAVRYPFLAAILSDEDVLVRGIFSSRRIPRGEITAVTFYPTIRWTDSAERTHTTFVNALNVNRSRAFQGAIDNADRGRRILGSWANGASLSDESSFFGADSAATGRMLRPHAVSTVLGFASISVGVFSIVARLPRYGVTLPIEIAEVAAGAGIVLAVSALILRHKEDRATAVIAAIGGGLAVVGLATAVAFGPVSVPSYNQNQQGAGNGTDSFMELLPSTPITTPSPGPGSGGIDTSTAGTQARYSVNYLLVQIADKLIIPHPQKRLWPVSVAVRADGEVVTADGERLGMVPAGYTLTYIPTDNRTDFRMSLTDADGIGTVVDLGQNTSTAIG